MAYHRCLADIPDTPFQWVWPGRIPRAAVTLIIGDAGRGKSLITLDIAARVTTGAPWPGGEPGADPGNVLLLSAEDSLTRTVRTRLTALDANLRRVHYLNAGHWSGPIDEQPHEFTVRRTTAFGSFPAHLHDAMRRDAQHLADAVESLDDCRLVVLDPLPAYLRDDLGATANEVKASLAMLVSLADASGAAILAVAHRDQLLESQDKRQHSPLRTLAAMARAIYLVDRLPDDPGRNVMIAAKCNLAAPPSPLAYQVSTSAQGEPLITWSPAPPDFEFEGLQAAARAPNAAARPLTQTERAVAWLQGALAAGPVPSQELMQRAAAAGISRSSFYRARTRLGIQASNENQIGGSWNCALPSNETLVPEILNAAG